MPFSCLSHVTEQNVLSKNGTRRQAITFVFLYLQYPHLALALALAEPAEAC